MRKRHKLTILFLDFYLADPQGILSASVLSIIPLIRPYQWQSFLMPVFLFPCLSIFVFSVYDEHPSFLLLSYLDIMNCLQYLDIQGHPIICCLHELSGLAK